MTSEDMQQLTLQQPSNTAHSNSLLRPLRIVRPHHPLFGQTVLLIKVWRHQKKRYYIIELPDKTHSRIPFHWADDGKLPLPQVSSDLPVLTADSIRELILLIERLKTSHQLSLLKLAE
jgi:hypothetical protein